jgi:soluble lytic murein transglycosylase
VLAAGFGLLPGVSWGQDASPQSALNLDDLVREAAVRFALPEPWIRHVMGAESAFRVRAVSRAGAMGLMQLMPETAQQIGRQLKIGKFKDSRLTSDPKFNITLGRAYLDKMVDRFGGSYLLATAAYNAGPNRVRQWMDTYGDPRAADVDVVDWIESIPFDETRNYVQRVMENLQVYRSRLTKGPSALALEADLRRAVVN